MLSFLGDLITAFCLLSVSVSVFLPITELVLRLQPTASTATSAVNSRQLAIDYMKGALVIGMVLAHALQLLSQPRGVLWAFSMLINLISFSGFFFCFGYVFYRAYLSKPLRRVWVKMLRTALKTLTAYYLSGLASFLFLPQQLHTPAAAFSAADLYRLVTLGQLAWVSEFLLAFGLITGLALVCFRGFVTLINARWGLLSVGVLCLVIVALLPPHYSIARPWSLLLGTSGEPSFPLVPYLPLFLAGLYCSRYGVVWHRWFGIVALLGSSSFVGYYLSHRSMPAEFRPSIYWLIGSYGILYGYYLTAHWLDRRWRPVDWLLSIGRNSLVYLLLSNFMLFALNSRLQVSSLVALGIGGLIVVIVGFLIGLIHKPSTLTGVPRQPLRASEPTS